MATTFDIREHVLESSHIREYWRATSHSQEESLKIHIKQYIPKDNPNPQPGDVTIIGAHANGFPKELYEAFWEALHATSKKQGFRIRGIWIADVAQQGASSVINESHLGNDPSWYDHCRDLLHMINTYRSQMPLPLIGIGHSMGACQLTNVALIHPRLFTSLVLLDPVLQDNTPKPGHSSVMVDTGYMPARASTFRRDIWPSREEAAKLFLKSPYYQAWDQQVFEAWLRFGLRDAPTQLYPDEQGVTLTCTKHNEVRTFLRPITNIEETLDLDPVHLGSEPSTPFYRHEIAEVYHRLPALRPSVYYVFGGESNMSFPEAQEAKMARTGTGLGGSGGRPKGRVDSVTLQGIGHLVAMEVPGRCAEFAAPWIEKELKRWLKKREVYEQWTKLSLAEKTTISEEWKDNIGRPKKKKQASESKL